MRILDSIISDFNNFTIPDFAQKLMDDEINCCFNCIHFKLLKHGGVYRLEEYKNLEAHCTNVRAIEEKLTRKRIVVLRIFFHVKTEWPKCRVNCNWFELA